MELVEVYDKVDTAANSDISYSSEDKPKRKDKRKLIDLKKEIQNYANTQKSYKRKAQTN